MHLVNIVVSSALNRQIIMYSPVVWNFWFFWTFFSQIISQMESIPIQTTNMDETTMANVKSSIISVATDEVLKKLVKPYDTPLQKQTKSLVTQYLLTLAMENNSKGTLSSTTETLVTVTNKPRIRRSTTTTSTETPTTEPPGPPTTTAGSFSNFLEAFESEDEAASNIADVINAAILVAASRDSKDAINISSHGDPLNLSGTNDVVFLPLTNPNNFQFPPSPTYAQSGNQVDANATASGQSSPGGNNNVEQAVYPETCFFNINGTVTEIPGCFTGEEESGEPAAPEVPVPPIVSQVSRLLQNVGRVNVTGIVDESFNIIGSTGGPMSIFFGNFINMVACRTTEGRLGNNCAPPKPANSGTQIGPFKIPSLPISLPINFPLGR